MRTKSQIMAEIRAIRTNPENYVTRTLRADPYSLVTNSVLAKIPGSSIFEGMSWKEIRQAVKEAVMTAFYNSKAEPKRVFGEGAELDAFYLTLRELFPGAMNVLEALNDRWDNEADYHEWTLPDGHVSHVKVMETIGGVLEIEGLKLAYRYRANTNSKTGTSLAPNFVHSIDGFIVRYIVLKADFPVVHVHDQIDFHPNHGDEVRKLYLEAIALVAESKLLEKFCERDFNIDVSAVVKAMKDSQYALC